MIRQEVGHQMLVLEDNTDLNTLLKQVHSNGAKVQDRVSHKDLTSGIKTAIQWTHNLDL